MLQINRCRILETEVPAQQTEMFEDQLSMIKDSPFLEVFNLRTSNTKLEYYVFKELSKHFD